MKVLSQEGTTEGTCNVATPTRVAALALTIPNYESFGWTRYSKAV